MNLGQKVKFSKILIRASKNNGHDFIFVKKDVPETTGLVIGKRNKSNGFMRGSFDDGVEYVATNYFTAFLVVFNMNRNPVFVHPDDLTPVEGDS